MGLPLHLVLEALLQRFPNCSKLAEDNVRNRRLFEGEHVQPELVIKLAEDNVSELARLAEHKGEIRATGEVIGGREWQRPAAGFTKFNCDAAVSDTRGSGIGFIGRDDTGGFLLAGHKEVAFTKEVEVAEAESILWAMTCASERGITRIHMETDCSSLISKMRNGYNGRGALRQIISGIQELAADFEVVVWSHVRRSGNGVARELAGHRPCLASLFCSVDSLPQDIAVLFWKKME